MRITELYIENFGKLSNYKKSFSEGVNCILEENGFGKTTLSVFIKVMLYGFDDTKKASLDENERKRYLPWQGGAFGGWLSFSALGGDYRIERTFGQKSSDDTFTLINLDTGMPTQVFTEKLGEELFGIDSDGFERTIFLSEKNICGKNTNQTISAKLSNIVEVEGDIGGFDNALKLLDERRKFYQKKGGSGEIHDLEESIINTENEIRDIKKRQLDAATLEVDIAKLSEKAKAAKAKKEQLHERQRKENLEREQKRYQNQYMEMLGALKVDEDRELALLEFFSKKIPNAHEIGAVSDCLSEATRLRKTLDDLGMNTEFSSLKDFFKKSTTEEECDIAVSRSQAIEDKKGRYATLIISANEPIAVPFKKIPAKEELIENKKLLSSASEKKPKWGSGILAALGIGLSALGSYMGYTSNKALYSIAIIGLLLTIVGISSLLGAKSKKIGKKNKKSVLAFISSITSVSADEDLGAQLDRIESDLNKYHERIEAGRSIEKEAASLLLDIQTEERKLREFIEGYPVTDTLTPKDAVLEIRRKFIRYTILRESESENETKRENISARIIALRENADRFLSLFPTTTEKPLDEIRTNLAEYEVLHASLTRRKYDCDRFARMHAITITPDTVPESPDPVSTVDSEIREIDEEILHIERERADLKINYNNLLRDSDKIDELEEKLTENNERIALYIDNLSIIKKTMAMLTTAKNNMTARYLDPTRKSFAKYMTLIDGDAGEYIMDTSFSIMKTDLGKSRQAEAYSRGTRDLHSLAIRLALIDSLYESEKPPVILDDPFASFDDKHTDKALSVLKKLSSDSQIIYFTCSKSRRAK